MTIQLQALAFVVAAAVMGTLAMTLLLFAGNCSTRAGRACGPGAAFPTSPPPPSGVVKR